MGAQDAPTWIMSSRGFHVAKQRTSPALPSPANSFFHVDIIMLRAVIERNSERNLRLYIILLPHLLTCYN